MGDIQVPTGYKHMLRREKQSTEDYKAQIKNYIENNTGNVAMSADFIGLLGTSSAMLHIKKLMGEGYITRSRVRGHRGKRFTYRWHSVPLGKEQSTLMNGGIVTRQLDVPTDPTIDDLRNLFMEWWHITEPSGELVNGALSMVSFIEHKLVDIRAERRRKLYGGENGNTDS